ncbi:hypothetical protein [Jeotgalibacillus malaysiensis]|uniref:hypothetical protein n=1 Tax=Jeotgalibacillus malaysiensis TaxID=1508404 RepID=UPI003850449F
MMTPEQFAKELEAYAKEKILDIESGVNQVAEDVHSTSQKLAPLDEGGLMESGSVEPAVTSGSKIEAKVGYNKEYALRMHEDIYNLGETSRKKPNVDGMTVGRKYLSQPLEIKSDQYMNFIFDRLKD